MSGFVPFGLPGCCLSVWLSWFYFNLKRGKFWKIESEEPPGRAQGQAQSPHLVWEDTPQNTPNKMKWNAEAVTGQPISGPHVRFVPCTLVWKWQFWVIGSIHFPPFGRAIQGPRVLLDRLPEGRKGLPRQPFSLTKLVLERPKNLTFIPMCTVENILHPLSPLPRHY